MVFGVLMFVMRLKQAARITETLKWDVPVIGAFTWYATRQTRKQVPEVAIEPASSAIGGMVTS
jgi:hypothetical protein